MPTKLGAGVRRVLRPVGAPARLTAWLPEAVAAMTLALLVAWLAGWHAPLSLLAGWPEAQPAALVGLLLLAIAARCRWPVDGGREVVAGRVLAAGTAVAAAVAAGLNLADLAPTAAPRWVVAVVLTLLGATIAVGDVRRWPRATFCLAAAGLLALAPALLAYAIDRPTAFLLTRATGISAPCAALAALLWTLVATRLLAERPPDRDAGFVGQLVLRRVAPVLIALPIVVRLFAEAAGALGASPIEAEALADLVMVVVLAVALWSVVRYLADRDLANRARRVAEDRFRVAFEEAPIGVAVVAPDGHILDANAAFAEVVGRPTDALTGTHFAELTHPDDLVADQSLLDELLAGTRDTYDLRKRYVRPDGTTVTAALHVGVLRDPDGTPVQLVAQVLDLTDRLRDEETLRHAATHDALTGLPNRRLLLDRLGVALAEAARGGSHVGILFVDLDDFKRVNDTIGHGGGDEVLRVVAERLRTSAREADTVARVGGDEFVVLAASNTAPHDLDRLQKRLRDAVERPVALGDALLVPRVSIGGHLTPGGVTPAAALSGADARMYAVKRDRAAG
ncbi:diguanylate cyclase [Nitriliruptoraceae bacterium ZYF776]|nr:diguanylate cyclase [Profundirhabdus halotolerans]